MLITALIPFAAFSLVAAVLWTVLDRRRKTQRNNGRASYFFIVHFLGVLYVITVVSVLFKAGTLGYITGRTHRIPVNYVPFTTITQYLDTGNWVQLVGNFIALLPLPILLHAIFPRMTFRKCLVISLCTTALIEPVQLLIDVIVGGPANVIDIDDFLLNMAGCVVGLLILKVFPRSLIEGYRSILQ